MVVVGDYVRPSELFSPANEQYSAGLGLVGVQAAFSGLSGSLSFLRSARGGEDFYSAYLKMRYRYCTGYPGFGGACGERHAAVLASQFRRGQPYYEEATGSFFPAFPHERRVAHRAGEAAW